VTDDPYHIFVSEIMLQQTQVARVMAKYGQFLAAFPCFLSLAHATLREILKVWQGMGYNRRAQTLKKSAELVVEQFDGQLPSSPGELMTLPGVGRTTASAIAAFAFQEPAVFVETNIRTVFIHFFFRNGGPVKDSEIIPLVARTLDTNNPRKWYYALMDYGVMLKKKHKNPNRKSAHYKKQDPFKGSNREIRGMIIRVLLAKPHCSERELIQSLSVDPERINRVLIMLQKEGFVKKSGTRFAIAPG
jgi:A/G-specific adenine glycosylase